MWSHLLYTAFKGDVTAFQWCQFPIARWNILPLFASFSQNPETSTIADGINYTGDLARYVLDRLFDNLTDKSY